MQHLKTSKYLIKLIILLVSVITLLLINTNCYSEPLRFKHLSISDGLSNNTVYCIFEDSHGFMWFGTQDGLNRYDGYNFKVFKHNPDDSLSITHNYIKCIIEDKSGQLWIGTGGGGLNLFDYRKETFLHIPHGSIDSLRLSNHFIHSLFEDDDGSIWICTGGGDINRLNPQTKVFKHYTLDRNNPHTISHNYILSVFKDNHGQLWFGTAGHGLNRYNFETDNFTRFPYYSGDTDWLSKNVVRTIVEDSQNRLWIGTYGGLELFNPETGQYQYWGMSSDAGKGLNNRSVWQVIEDKDGSLLIATWGGGLNRFDPESETFTYITHDPKDLNSLHDNALFAFYRDSKNTLWFGGANNGIGYTDIASTKFGAVRTNQSQKNGLSPYPVSSFHKDRWGNLWIGTINGGIDQYILKTGKYIYHQHQPNKENSLSSNSVMAICEDSSGVLWIGTEGGGLNRYDSKLNQWQRFLGDHKNPNSLNHNAIHALCYSSKNILWIGTAGGGLNRFDPAISQFMHYRRHLDDPHSLNQNEVTTIFEDKRGIIWVGTAAGGLNRLDENTGKFDHFYPNPDVSDSFIGNRINSICQVSDGTFWLGTDLGICHFNPRENTFQRFTEDNGLINDYVHSIMKDENGILWLSTNRGMSRFNPSDTTFQNFDIHDGLQDYQFSQGACYYDKETGEMYFGGLKGYNVFHPDSLFINQHVPPIYITDFKIMNESVSVEKDKSSILDKAIHLEDKIVLSYKNKMISFEFTALDYQVPKKNQYAYMLEGFDKEWIYCGNRRYAGYTNIPPGHYIFHVKGSNNDGVWNEKGASLHITITPPFWETIWFRLLTIIIFIGLILYVYYRRMSLLQKETLAQQEISRRLIEVQEDERKRIAGELHDSLGQNLLIVKNEVDYTIRSLPELKETNADLSNISQIVSESIDEVRTISHNLHPHILDRLGLVRAIESVVEQVTNFSKIQIILKIDPVDNLLSNASEIHLYRIIQEGLNNIVKHANAKSVLLSVLKNDHTINIELNDDGKGFVVDTKHEGFGLSSMAERVRILKGEHSVKSQPSTGTQLKIQIPII